MFVYAVSGGGQSDTGGGIGLVRLPWVASYSLGLAVELPPPPPPLELGMPLVVTLVVLEVAAGALGAAALAAELIAAA